MSRLLVLLLLAPLAFGDVDVAVDSFDAHTAVAFGAGERFYATAIVRNHSDEPAHDVVIVLHTDFAWPMELPRWRDVHCDPLFVPDETFVCRMDTLPARGALILDYTFIATEERVQRMRIDVYTSSRDAHPTNNSGENYVFIGKTKGRVDLGVRVTPEQIVPPGAPAAIRVEITNHGGGTAKNIYLGDRSGLAPSPHIVIELPPGEAVTFVVDVPPREREETLRYVFEVFAEDNLDLQTANNIATAVVSIGSAESWRRVLIPLVASTVSGANRAQWTTDVTMLLRGDDVDVRPGVCEFAIGTCGPPDRPHNRPFLLEGHPVSFLYVRAADAHKLKINARAYDRSRGRDTAGAEIPIAREEDFTGARTSLLGIPFSPRHRYTLRVYDADGRGGARVLVHFYVNDEEQPRATTVATLAVNQREQRRTTTALLPVYPATVQLDPLQFIAFDARFERLRIDVEPAEPGLRLWSFVSVTSNDTHHVTTVSQQ
jgi:hypothetical protein